MINIGSIGWYPITLSTVVTMGVFLLYTWHLFSLSSMLHAIYLLTRVFCRYLCLIIHLILLPSVFKKSMVKKGMCKGRKVWEKRLVSSNPNTAIGKSNPRIILGCSKKRASVVQGLSKSDTVALNTWCWLCIFTYHLSSLVRSSDRSEKNHHNYLHITPDIPDATLRILLLQNGKKK